ncbi:Pyruvate decarboxylase 2 [Lathyrus oleraceus]|uniref:pyruvate decarboxylase n=1 Tax=Pisum sativum TaxID=3888 RepID=A0A9D4XAD4_PEA|nr:Pyruvate decarboxylase 2 [Pisum sativum]
MRVEVLEGSLWNCLPQLVLLMCKAVVYSNKVKLTACQIVLGLVFTFVLCETAVIAETGDSWFNCQKLKLPEGCGYEFQMQYGSIGWSVGATLAYAQVVPEKRVIACIGDGSFQVTAQDVSTMLRCGQKTIIFLINNGGYTIEV